MKTRKLLTIFVAISLLLNLVIPYTFADELDDTVKEKEAKEQEKQQTESQLFQAKQYEGTLASQLSQMTNDLYLARSEYANAVAKLNAKQQEISENETNIKTREEEVNYQTSLISARIRDLYKNSQYPPLSYLFLSDDFNKVNTEYVYRMNVINEDKKNITDLKDKIDVLNRERAALERDKTQMAEDKIDLENQKVHLEAQEVYLNSQIASARNTQNQLASQLTGITKDIANLSAKEQQILAAKAAAAAASTSVGSKEQNGGVISEGTPSKTSGDFYSFWSYGFPHRVGMNQYGAYGRALAGQTVRTILHSYYANTTITGLDAGTSAYPVPEKIKVDGYGWISFEDLYLKGIGEMPSSWSMEALKAQAIAARSYALAYISYANYQNYTEYKNDPNAKSICTTQACQVFIGHVKDERWAQAVTETKGMVLLSSGVPITAYYASTAGGSTLSSEEVWGGYRPYALSLIDVDSTGKPFDGPGYGDSPWYHKSWGDDPWLSKEEVADMANAALLPEEYNDNLPSSANGGFTPEEVRAKLTELDLTVVANIKSIEVVVGAKQTESMRIYYDDTYVNLDPGRFLFVFNLRSPGTDAIWSSRFDIQ